MTKYAKIMFISLIAVALLAGPAMAAVLSNSQDNPFGTGNSTSNSYRIAYEIYSDELGISTITERGGIGISLTQPLNVGDSANLLVSSGNAVFNSAGSNYKWGLWYDADGDGYLDVGEISAYNPNSGLTQANIPFSVVGWDTGEGRGNVPPGSFLRLLQWQDTDSNNDWTEGEGYVLGAGLYVSPGLGATCGNTVLIKVGFTTPRETTAPPANFAYITPQFGGAGPSRDTLTAELDTDTDFRYFLEGSGPYVTEVDTIWNSEFLRITDNADSGSNILWVAYAEVSPEGRVQFDVNSIVGQPAAAIEFYSYDSDGYEIYDVCSANTARTTFSCDLSGASLVNNHGLYLYVDGVDSNEPTNWTLTNVQIDVTSTGLNNLCIEVPTTSVGVWYGGLEALVPFVKGSTDGAYDTYIVLFNRYGNDAKVYVSTFKDALDTPIMVSTGQIIGKEQIPSDGRLVVTAGDIQSFLAGQGISWNSAEGIPVKFNIRVPSQVGATNYTRIGGPLSGQGIITDVNPYDPYVEGIVVSAYPGGQRTIPLKFKTFKQGMYGH